MQLRYFQFFTDRQDGNNALVDAAQDINATNVLKAVKKGAYIDVYSSKFNFFIFETKHHKNTIKFCTFNIRHIKIDFFSEYGNTPLHVASKSGYPEIVEILIKNGADRTLLNAQNKTAEQLIPPNYKTTDPESIERYEKIKLIFKKYQKKKFRRRLPDVFPVSSYKIYIDEQAIDQMSNSFMERFIAIVSKPVKYLVQIEINFRLPMKHPYRSHISLLKLMRTEHWSLMPFSYSLGF